MKFFTDHTVDNSYLLIKIKDYIKGKHKKREYKEVYVDPGVYELTKSDVYSWEKDIDIKDFLDTLPENHYFSADYPCDMIYLRKDIDKHYQGILRDRFLDRSWFNAIKYCNHPNYIVTVQSQFNNYWSFTHWFDKYNDLPIRSGIMGLGNICRILQLTDYIKHSLDYAFSHCKHRRIHIYGLCLRAIPYAYKLAKKYNIELTMDSTKWTRPVTKELKLECGISCKSKDRQKYFDEYMKVLKQRGVNIE